MSSTPNYGFESTIMYNNSDAAIDRELKRVEDKADQNTADLTGKVDKLDGHSLIPADRLEQITHNQNHIECLSSKLVDAKNDIADRYTKAEVDAKLECKASKCELEKHIIDPHAHQELFDQKVDKKDGYSLISDADKGQITINQNDIAALGDRVTANEVGIADRYTKSETDGLLTTAIHVHNSDPAAHEDIRAELANKANYKVEVINLEIRGETGSATPTTNECVLVRVGPLVIFNFRLITNPGTLTGRLYLGGLRYKPYLPSDTETPISAQNIQMENITGASLRLYNGSNVAALQAIVSKNNLLSSNIISAENLKSNTEIKGTISYVTNDPF